MNRALTPEGIRYHLLITDTARAGLFVMASLEGFCLPEVCVPVWQRPAQALQTACLRSWNVHAIVACFLPVNRGSDDRYAVLEIVAPYANGTLKRVDPRRSFIRLADEQMDALTTLSTSGNGGSTSALGWIQEAITWVEASVGCHGVRPRENWDPKDDPLA
ncbi:hypothetical protein SAMN05443244_0947 [Terriglobus roseus]|uniref:Uncharacterized protein n=1 Tax=Terriglobus roseus TaxID=392734 RepID=A0A1H4K182_9BACT|nr:hypothetical protein SAMN05443244_0947 [Terriglobus roseus]